MSRGVILAALAMAVFLHGSPPRPAAAQELRMLAREGVARQAADPNSAAVATVAGGTPLELEREMRAWYAVRLPAEGGTEHRVGYVSVSDVEWVVECRPAGVGRFEPGDVFRDCDAAPEMVVVPAGSFTMGSPPPEAGRYDNEGPRREVTIGAPFAVGVFELTFAQWEICARTGGCGDKEPYDNGWGRGQRPAINVSWADAGRYVAWLSRLTGKPYRLLSEAEWEYAARAGADTARWGIAPGELCRYANGFDERTAARTTLQHPETPLPCADEYPGTAPVGSFLPNAFGLHDMLGNVREWTQDCYRADLSGIPIDGSARESGQCLRRVARGSSWLQGVNGSRLAFRIGAFHLSEYSVSGIRVARDLE